MAFWRLAFILVPTAISILQWNKIFTDSMSTKKTNIIVKTSLTIVMKELYGSLIKITKYLMETVIMSQNADLLLD